MSMKPKTKFSAKPKLADGAKLLEMMSQGASSAKLGSSMTSMIPEVQQNVSQYAGKSVQLDSKLKDGRQALEGAATMLGPAGIAIAAASKVGRAVDTKSKDEFGVYKNKGFELADKVLDPVGNVQDLVSGRTFKNMKNRFSGKDPQADLIEKRNDFMANQSANNQADAIEQASILTPEIPLYQAPKYGRRGLKLSTRYSTRH